MEKPFKFILPSPNFDKTNVSAKAKPHFLTPSGMTLLPREKQPPPMYGKRGATVPGKFLQPVAQAESIPEPVKQYCEPCEMELSSLDDFRRHRSQHENCPVDGCQFRGHPSVMDKHVTALHSSGLFDKFKKLSTPEEIAAWREERRKRYPSVANVLLKQKAMAQRQKRGERLENNKSRFGRQDDRKRTLPSTESSVGADNSQCTTKTNNTAQGNRGKNKRKRRNNRDKREDKAKACTSVKKSERSDTEDTPYLMFCGTLQMKDYKHINNKKKTPTNNALFGLVGMYGSDDESEEDNSDDGEVDDPDDDRCNVCDNGSDKSPDENNDDLINIQTVESDSKEVEVCDTESLTNQCKVPNKVLLDISTERPTVEVSINELNVHSPQNSAATNEKSADTFLTQCNVTCETKDETPVQTTLLTTTKNGNSSDEGPEEAPIERSIPEYQIKTEKLPPTNSTPSVRTEELPRKHAKQSAEETKTRQIMKRKSGLDYRKSKVRKQNTMLEKLLESDIRHERNVLLQCVRYVCENNFFGVGQQTSITITPQQLNL